MGPSPLMGAEGAPASLWPHLLGWESPGRGLPSGLPLRGRGELGFWRATR